MLIMYLRGDCMLGNEKSNIILMVQSAHKLFCYFNISSMEVKEFENKYGENSWKSSKPVIKVLFVESGIAREMKTIFIDDFANNSYIDIDKGDQDIFLKFGRMLPDNTFAALTVSNTVTTPRNYESCDTALYFVDVSQKGNLSSQSVIATQEAFTNNVNNHENPKAYPFMNKRNIYNAYPQIIISESCYQNDFFSKYFEELKNKYNLSSSKAK